MTISVLNDIPDVVLSRNPVAVKLSTDNAIETAGVAAVVVLDFSGGGAAADEKFSLEWTEAGEQLTFTFKASPNNSGNQLPAYSAGTITDWLDSVVTYLNYNYLLSRDFSLYKTGPGAETITILALETGADYSLTVVNNVANMVVSTNTAGVDEEMYSNFQLVVDVYVQDTYATTNTDYKRKASIGLVPDASGDAVFHIEKIVAAHIAGYFPSYGLDESEKATEAFKKFKYRYAEYYGLPPTHKRVTTSKEFFMMRGGLKFMDWPENDFYSTWLPANKRFLTWKSGTRKVATDQQEFLSFLNHSATSTTLTLKVKMNYTDGTNSTATGQEETGTIEKEIFIFPVGYTQLDIDTLKTAGKTVESYEVYIDDQAGVTISETVVFWVDNTVYANKRVFYYENSLGGIDSLVCTGKREDNISVMRLSTERILEDYWDADNVVDYGNYENYENTYSFEYAISSGYKSKKQAVTEMIELLISPVIKEDTGEWMPVILKKDTFKLYKDEEDAFFVQFDYAQAFENVGYSELEPEGSGS